MASCTLKSGTGGTPEEPIKISIVDDDENERWQMTRDVDQSPDLERVGSYSSGLEALEKIPSSASDLVLMDVRMPGASGIEVTKRLKELRPALFIFLISGFDDPQTAAQARQAGADAYLTKPFSSGRFFETLTACLRRRKLGVHGTHTARDFLPCSTTERSEPAPAENSSLPTTVPWLGIAIQHRTNIAEQGPRLLTDEPGVRRALLKMVIALEHNPQARQDLLQEAFVYFWRSERQHPGRPLSWYVQGVKFHLQNLRTAGRSLDSPKRRGTQAMFPDNCDEWDEWLDSLEFDEGIMSEIQARDTFSVLVDRLEPIDRTILTSLAEGLRIRDVAEKLHVSHMFISRHRRGIARAAMELGINPLAASPLDCPSSKAPQPIDK